MNSDQDLDAASNSESNLKYEASDLEATLIHWRTSAAKALRKLIKIKDLHNKEQDYGGNWYCAECLLPWPCKTVVIVGSFANPDVVEVVDGILGPEDDSG